MSQISNAACELATERWEHELSTLHYELERLKQKQRDDDTTYEEHMQCLSGENISLKAFTKEDEMRKISLTSLPSRFENYMCQIPVLGFCSSRYDINVVNEKLLVQLNLHQVEEGHDF